MGDTEFHNGQEGTSSICLNDFLNVLIASQLLCEKPKKIDQDGIQSGRRTAGQSGSRLMKARSLTEVRRSAQLGGQSVAVARKD